MNHQLEVYCNQLLDKDSIESEDDLEEQARVEREEFFGADFENERVHANSIHL